MFFASNSEFSGFNGTIFNILARSLNNVCYWISQIIGSVLIGLFLYRKSISRRIRAYTGRTVLFLMLFVVHTWGCFYQKQCTRESVAPETEEMDIYDHGYTGRVWFISSVGFSTRCGRRWRTGSWSIWSAGAAKIWCADTVKIPYMNMFILEWALLVGGLVFALPMAILRIKNHIDLDNETIVRMDDKVHIRPTEAVTGGC
ncbi:hypothetical protein EV421DRAFT_767413 [Armillaria borealis]|uniref:Uncharacterized protein n=1 Tax=Armillaria borealis TaxID=47425 RepID=A0AA39MN21_9AGAR|nr:hypothetical protein EV421DRAFT_767413 [Armillaria borealis]